VLCCAVLCCAVLYLRLTTELSMVHEKKVIVFVNTKRQCDNVYAQLENGGYSCTVLHGGRNQDQREVSGTVLQYGDSLVHQGKTVLGDASACGAATPSGGACPIYCFQHLCSNC
jgi:hypothetical protein